LQPEPGIHLPRQCGSMDSGQPLRIFRNDEAALLLERNSLSAIGDDMHAPIKALP
jgi:hypothetical protein